MSAIQVMLRSTDPELHRTGARHLIGYLQVRPTDAGPDLLAGVTAAATGAEPKPGPREFAALINSCWRLAAQTLPDAAAQWAAAVVDLLADGPAEHRDRLVRVLAADPVQDRDGTSPYGPLLAPHGPRLLALLDRLLADTASRAAAAALADLLVAHVAADDTDTRSGLAERCPALLGPTTYYVAADRIRRLHPRPAEPLAALLDAQVRRPDDPADRSQRNRDWSRLAEQLLVEHLLELPALAAALAPHAAGWTDEQVELFARRALLADVPEAGFDRVRALRRSAARRAVPELLTGSGRSTPALDELAGLLRAATAPLPTIAPLAATAPRPAAAEPTPSSSGPSGAGRDDRGGVVFADAGIRLAVLDRLMYQQDVLPRFDVHAFVAAHPDRDIDPYAGCSPIPEVVAHFDAIALSAEQLATVTELQIVAEADIWSQLDPTWGGEDDWFPVRSFADVALLPNLRRITADAMLDEDVDRTPLDERGIELRSFY